MGLTILAKYPLTEWCAHRCNVVCLVNILWQHYMNLINHSACSQHHCVLHIILQLRLHCNVKVMEGWLLHYAYPRRPTCSTMVKGTVIHVIMLTLPLCRCRTLCELFSFGAFTEQLPPGRDTLKGTLEKCVTVAVSNWFLVVDAQLLPQVNVCVYTV